MSTTARKARKRAGITFVHPVKTATPVTERVANQPRAIFANQATMQQTRYGVTPKARRRLEARLPWKNGRPVLAQAAEQTDENIGLDPKPYRVGRKRYSIYDVINRFHQAEDENAEAVWSPRKQYLQHADDYGHDGTIPEPEEAA